MLGVLSKDTKKTQIAQSIERYSFDKKEFLRRLAEREAPRVNGAPSLIEGAIHQGQEQGNAPTTNYGVRIDLYPKLKGESDADHALRFFENEIKPYLSSLNIKGIDPMQFALITWNTGVPRSPLKYLDGSNFNLLEDQLYAFSVLVRYIHTTENNKKVWSKGLVNARVDDWNTIAKVVNPSKVVNSYKVFKNNGVTSIVFTFVDGTTKTTTTDRQLSSLNTIKYGELITTN